MHRNLYSPILYMIITYHTNLYHMYILKEALIQGYVCTVTYSRDYVSKGQGLKDRDKKKIKGMIKHTLPAKNLDPSHNAGRVSAENSILHVNQL